jgi:hypothetical protein
VVGLVVLVGGGDDDDGGLDASSAAEAVRSLDDEVEAEVFEAGGTTLGECPVGDIRDLVDFAPSGFDAADAAEDDVDAIAVDTSRRSDPTSFQCTVSGDDGGSGDTTFGVLVNVTPEGDIRDYIDRSLPDHTVDFEDDVKHRGGKLISYCADSDIDNGVDFCETDWVGDGIELGLYASGDGADAELTSDWLIATLDTLIAELERLDVDDIVTTT